MPEPRFAWVKNAQTLINIYVFVNVLGVILWQIYSLHKQNRLDFIEITFILNNCVLAWVVLIRQKHIAVDKNLFHQCIALIAFFSGIAFTGQPASQHSTAINVSQAVLLAASLLGLITLLQLKDSFGILIACRTIKTGGLYRFVRHPMYVRDILLRVGYLISHCTALTAGLVVLSAACYVYRALLEEKFLCEQSGEYMQYKKTVRYRFIPGIL
ncbi:MAG: hypothetical protein FWG29_00320 [Treponema sp.]|nr:hypothetical protein [Treponema sp.]